MKELGYGKDYLYPHDFPQHWVAQQYLPDGMEQVRFYTPSTSGIEPHFHTRKSPESTTPNEADNSPSHQA